METYPEDGEPMAVAPESEEDAQELIGDPIEDTPYVPEDAA